MEMIDAIKKKLEGYEGAAYPNGPYMQTVRALIYAIEALEMIQRPSGEWFPPSVQMLQQQCNARYSAITALKQIAKELGVNDE